jgi:iduronate 2-sulfatase
MTRILRRSFAMIVTAAMLLPLTTLTSFSQAKSKPKYNVLFISADDLRPELGAYGVKDIKTPNIDKIAARGTRFDRAYAQFPVCNPSRASLLTGKYPTQNGVMNNNDYFRRKFPDIVTLPQYFKNNGYVTLRSGKIFHGGIDDQVSWTEGGEPTDPNITERGNPNFRPAQASQSDPAFPSSAPPTPGDSRSDRIVVLEGDGEEHGDYRATTRAINMMEKHKDKRFFLALGLVKPHSPPTAPKKFFDLYDVNKIPLPVDFGTTPKALPDAPAISISPRNSDIFIGRESPPDLAREMKRAYWASTSFMDAQVGRIMEALEKNGLKDNTIVVFWGDHGYHLGEKGKWSKAYSLYELGLKVPLIIAVPKGKANATTRVVELVDLYPTLAEMCGLPRPTYVSGDSFAKLVKEPNSPFDRPAFAIVEIRGITGRSVRTAKWHYAEWDEGKEGRMLYATETDPHELKNLAEDPKHAVVVAEMKKLLAGSPIAKKVS